MSNEYNVIENMTGSTAPLPATRKLADMSYLPSSAELANLEQFLNQIDAGLEPVREMFANYNCAVYEVETKFKVLNERFSVRYDSNPIETIKTRTKCPDSIIRKLGRKGVPFSLASIEENVLDVAGVRVICSFVEDIYLLADYLLSQDDVELIEKKDYIKYPKESGYRSLHLIIRTPIFTEKGKKMMPVEVQLRTIAMDFWASLEHKLRYKKNLDPELLASLGQELADCADRAALLDERMQRVKNEIEGQ
ncbi:MAG: GTP pyrophosphokinase family protein [Lachnospiraceae bacterium]|nr:GTP pyrophosphokinase family protein [Lachnospiraceae bacterium]